LDSISLLQYEHCFSKSTTTGEVRPRALVGDDLLRERDLDLDLDRDRDLGDREHDLKTKIDWFQVIWERVLIRTQYGNFRIFLSTRSYVKSILENAGVLRLLIFATFEPVNLVNFSIKIKIRSLYSHGQELFYKFFSNFTNKLVKQLLSMTVYWKSLQKKKFKPIEINS